MMEPYIQFTTSLAKVGGLIYLCNEKVIQKKGNKNRLLIGGTICEGENGFTHFISPAGIVSDGLLCSAVHLLHLRRYIDHAIFFTQGDALFKRKAFPILVPVIRNTLSVPIYDLDFLIKVFALCVVCADAPVD